MGLDAVCLSAVVAELTPAVVGGRIDKIHQPTRDEVLLSVRGGVGNVKLLLSATPGGARIHLTKLGRENPAQPPMFCMLLRKHLTGARILALTQPGLDRVVELTLETRDELGDRMERRLVLELMGRRTNLILLDAAGRVTECLRRVEGDMTRGERQVLPGLFYHPPEYRPGVSPLLARELDFRGADREDTLSRWTAQAAAGESVPTLVLRGGKAVDFSFFPILQYGLEGECRTYPTFSLLMDDFYEQRESRDRARQRGQDLLRTVTASRDRVARRLRLQEQDLANTYDRDKLRRCGDLITANLYAMERGMDTLRTADYYDPDQGEVEIKLDPLLTPQQNAAKYYRDYNKAKTAERVLTGLLETGRAELGYLESVLDALSRTEGERELQEIRQELSDGGYLRRGQKRAALGKRVSTRPLTFRTTAGLRVSVGKNNTQNDQLTTKQAGKNDLWLHTQKIHGSHVILWTEGETPDAESITEAAMLAAWFSQGRDGTRVPVDYTPVRHVKKPAGAKPGMVVYATYQTALVNPDGDLVKKLAEMRS